MQAHKIHTPYALQPQQTSWQVLSALYEADEEDAMESRRLREALAESQAKEAAMEAQEVNLRQQLCSAQSQTCLLHELQQKLCEDGAQLQELERDKAELEEQLDEKLEAEQRLQQQLQEKLESERCLQQQLSDLQQATHDPESWLTPL
ncbi:hypothetical protein WJX74_001242 [Apatococcus lobatus]|uniref:Uncharacterized protein n=1 Tax=Apatococcus lobatus TaxID=904363 RepID=A0AAW1Q1M9_9CHLO